MFNECKTIYSLFDHTGNSMEPYRENGYACYQIDIKHGQDIRLLEVPPHPVYGIIAMPPCTDFASSGARWWNEKDQNGDLLKSLELIGAMTRFILACDYMYNLQFWVVENPVGRLNRWLGNPKYYFHPHYFGDPYTKKTGLWGRFNKPNISIHNYVEPTEGSKFHTMPACKNRKEIRSITPLGFAQAFYEANK